MYDLALKDFEEMEEELLLIASHFISKDQGDRSNFFLLFCLEVNFTLLD